MHISSHIWQTDRWFNSEYLTNRWVMQRVSHQISPVHSSVYQIFYEIFICVICLPLRYSLLNHLPVCQIFDPESLTCLADIQSCLAARYSILNHLPIYQLFDPESPAHLLDIRFWITCLPVRYSMRYSPLSPTCLHHA